MHASHFLYFYVATHPIQKVEVLTSRAAGNLVFTKIIFAHNTSARGAQIAMIPEDWNKFKCENIKRENVLQKNDVIETTPKIRTKGIYHVETRVIGANHRLDRYSQTANRSVQIENGKLAVLN